MMKSASNAAPPRSPNCTMDTKSSSGSSATREVNRTAVADCVAAPTLLRHRFSEPTALECGQLSLCLEPHSMQRQCNPSTVNEELHTEGQLCAPLSHFSLSTLLPAKRADERIASAQAHRQQLGLQEQSHPQLCGIRIVERNETKLHPFSPMPSQRTSESTTYELRGADVGVFGAEAYNCRSAKPRSTTQAMTDSELFRKSTVVQGERPVPQNVFALARFNFSELYSKSWRHILAPGPLSDVPKKEQVFSKTASCYGFSETNNRVTDLEVARAEPQKQAVIMNKVSNEQDNAAEQPEDIGDEKLQDAAYCAAGEKLLSGLLPEGEIVSCMKIVQRNLVTGVAEERLVQMMLIHRNPDIHYIPDLLTEAACDHVLELCKGRWERSKTSTGYASAEPEEYASMNSFNRTSWSVPLRIGETLEVQNIERLAAAFAGMSVDQLEPLVVVRYEEGQYFKPHHDGGFRPKTLLLYLNEVEDGGETRFENLGFQVLPRKKAGVLWRNSYPGTNEIDPRLLHAGLPPRKGSKYVINCFFNKNPHFRSFIGTSYQG